MMYMSDQATAGVKVQIVMVYMCLSVCLSEPPAGSSVLLSPGR